MLINYWCLGSTYILYVIDPGSFPPLDENHFYGIEDINNNN